MFCNKCPWFNEGFAPTNNSFCSLYKRRVTSKGKYPNFPKPLICLENLSQRNLELELDKEDLQCMLYELTTSLEQSKIDKLTNEAKTLRHILANCVPKSKCVFCDSVVTESGHKKDCAFFTISLENKEYFVFIEHGKIGGS